MRILRGGSGCEGRPGIEIPGIRVSQDWPGKMQPHTQFTCVHTPCCAWHDAHGQVMMQASTGAGTLPKTAAARRKNRARASFLSFKRVPFRATKASGPKKKCADGGEARRAFPFSAILRFLLFELSRGGQQLLFSCVWVEPRHLA